MQRHPASTPGPNRPQQRPAPPIQAVRRLLAQYRQAESTGRARKRAPAKPGLQR
jgi:hypothetical protein